MMHVVYTYSSTSELIRSQCSFTVRHESTLTILYRLSIPAKVLRQFQLDYYLNQHLNQLRRLSKLKRCRFIARSSRKYKKYVIRSERVYKIARKLNSLSALQFANQCL